MRRTATWCVAGLTALAIALPVAHAQQRGDRGGQGDPAARQRIQMMQAFMAVQSYWVALTFDLKVPDAKLTELRPKFQEAYDARKKAIEDARAKGDRSGVIEAVKQANQKLEAALEASLGQEDFDKLKQAATRGNMALMRAGRGAGGRRGER